MSSARDDDSSSCPGHNEGTCHLDDFFAQAYKSFESEAAAANSGAVSPQDATCEPGGPVDEEPAALLVRLIGLDCPNCQDPMEVTLTLCTETSTGANATGIQYEWEPLTLLCDPTVDLQQRRMATITEGPEVQRPLQQMDATVLFREVGKATASSSVLHIRMDRRGRLPTPRISLGGGAHSSGGGASGSFLLRPFGQAFADVGRAAAAGETITSGIAQLGDSVESGSGSGGGSTSTKDSRKSRTMSLAGDSSHRVPDVGQLKLQARIVGGAATAAQSSALLTSRPTRQLGLGRDDRDEAYLWLKDGEFGAAGSKEPNVEITAQVVSVDGTPVPAALANREAALNGRGGPRPADQQFRSRVLHHQPRPVWDQLVRLDLGRLQLDAEYHVALEAWHRSSRSHRGERRLGCARLPLVAMKQGVPCLSPDGARTVVFHDSDEAAVAAAAAVASSPTLSTNSQSTLSFEDHASGGKMKRPDSTNRINLSLEFCTGRRSSSWRLASLLLPLPHHQSRHRPTELRLDEEDQRDLLACFPGLLRSLLARVCAQESSVADPAFKSLVRLLALAAKQPQQVEAARLAACIAESPPPAGLHRALLRQLAAEVHRDFRLETGSQAVMKDLYDSVRPILRLVAASATREGHQRSELLQKEFEFLFRAFREHPIRPDNQVQCKFALGLITDCLPLLVAAAEPRWLWQQLWRLLADLRAGRLPTGVRRFSRLVEVDEFWRWPDTRLQLVEAAADHSIEALNAEKVKIEEQVRPGNLGMLESALKPLNEMLRRLGLLDAATTESEARLLASRGLLRPLLHTCALVVYDRPVGSLRPPKNQPEPKYLRLFLTGIVSLMELFNRAEGAWQAWLEAADGNSAAAAAAASSSWSAVVGLEIWPSLPAARTDLSDEAAELLQFLAGIFDQYPGRWGVWNGLQLLESAVAMETMRRLAKLLPLESLPSLAGAAFSSLFSFIQQPQAAASSGERRRHPRLAALPPDLRQPALETARSIWARLPAPERANLAPSLVPRLLRCAAAARPNQQELLGQAVGMLADVLRIPESSNSSAIELARALDAISEEQRADAGFGARLHRKLGEALAEDGAAVAVVSRVGEQLGLLRESGRHPSTGGTAEEPPEDPQALALHRLHRFYREAGLGQLAWRCQLRLWQLQERAARLTEAACCLAAMARSLDWSDEAPPGGNSSGFRLPQELKDCHTQAELKERLLQRASERFRAAGLPLKAKQLTEELRFHFRDREINFHREQVALLRLSALCQELQSPTLADRRRPVPTFFLVALGGEADSCATELPAGLRGANVRHFVCAFPHGAPIDKAAARLERLLPGAVVRPAGEGDGTRRSFEETEEDLFDEPEDFDDDDDGVGSGYAPSLWVRLHPLTPVSEPPMPGLSSTGGGSGGSDSAFSALLHHRYNDVCRFWRSEPVRKCRSRRQRRHLQLYETDEPLPAPVRLLPARLVESRRQGPLEVAAGRAESAAWELRCAARELADSASADPEEAAEDWRRVVQLPHRAVAEIDAALAELRAVEVADDDEAAAGEEPDADVEEADCHRDRLLGETRHLLEQAARCLELLCRRQPLGVGSGSIDGGGGGEVVEVATELLQRLNSLTQFREAAAGSSCRASLERLAAGSGPPVVSRNFKKRPSLV